MKKQTIDDRKRIFQDIFLIVISIVVAVIIVKTDVVHFIIERVHELEYFVSFLAGLFFTSAFTVAPSVAVLGELARESSPFVVAFFGGLGAMCGDFILFRFVRDRVAEDLRFLFEIPKAKRVAKIFSTILPRMLWPFFGALIIASPFPDEIGIVMMGLSKIDQRLFLPLSFILNGVGILLVGLAARAVS